MLWFSCCTIVLLIATVWFWLGCWLCGIVDFGIVFEACVVCGWWLPYDRVCCVFLHCAAVGGCLLLISLDWFRVGIVFWLFVVVSLFYAVCGVLRF